MPLELGDRVRRKMDEEKKGIILRFSGRQRSLRVDRKDLWVIPEEREISNPLLDW